MLTIEIVAALCGGLSVYFYIVRNHWSWPVGLVQVVLYVAVFAQSKLYADMLLHVVYAGLQVYGWWAWRHASGIASPDNATPHGHELSKPPTIVIRRISPRGAAQNLATVVLLTWLFYFLLSRFTDASMPLPDSLIAALSLVAQMLLAGRYLANWFYWIAVDIVGIGLFAYKELYPTAILYAVFLVMAIVGWIHWHRIWLKQQAASTMIADAMYPEFRL